MIIDCHSHFHEDNSLDQVFWFPGEPAGPLPMDRFAAAVAAQPVDHMLLSAHSAGLTTAEELRRRNGLVAEAARCWPGMISGLCQVNPHLPEVSLAELDRHVAAGHLVGIGELCQYKLDYNTDDPSMDPLIERAIELDVTILVHASREPHSSSLGRLAARFPKARFVMAHLGGMNNWPRGLAIARRHDNIWADTSGYVMILPGALERALAELGAGRILFGVDFPGINAAPLIAALDRLNLPPADYERIAFRNAAELFHLDLARIGAKAGQGGTA